MTVPRYRASNEGRRTPRRQATNAYTIPAPLGMNTMTPVASQSPQDCIYTYNLMPYELGLRTREGYQLHSKSFANPVRTVIPFNGETTANDRLFVASADGIFNASDGIDPSPSVYSWVGSDPDTAGYVTWTHYNNDADESFLMAADEADGMVEYSEATGLWTATTGITGADPGKVFFVMAHKRRLWLIERDSSSAWYLPTGAKAGAATQFNFGAQLREGGNLVGLYSWTIDGGDGVDDYMVALSREGGVAVYRGDDPANASTWALVGVWYIGRVPAGHRVASQYGGQLFLLSEHGLISMNVLLKGGSVDEAALAATDKITRIVRDNLLRTIDQRGWEIRQYPKENFFMLTSPLESGSASHITYARNMTTNGWGLMRSVPLFTGDVWRGDFYFGDGDENLWRLAGSRDRDRSRFFPFNPEERGSDLEFSMLTSYQLGDTPGFKRGQFARPYFLSAGLPAFSVQARWDYALNENDKAVVFNDRDIAEWDEAIWDTAVWATGVERSEAIRGISGYGHAVAIALRGRVAERATLVAIEVQLDTGGLL